MILSLSFSGQCEDNPIGLDDNVAFPDQSFQSSGVDASGFNAFEARFNDNGWCAGQGVPPPSLTIHFGRLINVCAVKTAGTFFAYSERLRVEFSVDGSSFFGSEVK